MLPHWKKKKTRQRPAHAAGRRLRMERCEDRLMLSGNDFVVAGTIDLFGDSLTDATNGGFIYRLDQGGEIGLDFTADFLVIRASGNGDGTLWHLPASHQIVRQSNAPALDFDQDIFLADTNYDSKFSGDIAGVPNLLGADFNVSNLPPSTLLDSSEALKGFLPETKITRLPLVPPVMAAIDNPTESVISLAGLFDANQRTHDTELLAIRSALLASHLHQSTPTENGGVQSASPIVLQEAESESTWDRVWSFELASFSPKQAVADSSDVSEILPVPQVVTPPLHHPSHLPTGDSLGRVSISREVVMPVEGFAISVQSQDQAFAELDRVALSSNGWGLAADRRGGLLISVVAILAAQRVWNAFPSMDSEEKEEPRRNNGTTKIKW